MPSRARHVPPRHLHLWWRGGRQRLRRYRVGELGRLLPGLRRRHANALKRHHHATGRQWRCLPGAHTDAGVQLSSVQRCTRGLPGALCAYCSTAVHDMVRPAPTHLTCVAPRRTTVGLLLYPQVSAWGLWSQCSAVCEGGTRYRTRTVAVQQANGGAVCGDLVEEEACNPDDCEPGGGDGLCVGCIGGTSGECRGLNGVCYALHATALVCPGDTSLCDTSGSQECELTGWSAWGRCSRCVHM